MSTGGKISRSEQPHHAMSLRDDADVYQMFGGFRLQMQKFFCRWRMHAAKRCCRLYYEEDLRCDVRDEMYRLLKLFFFRIFCDDDLYIGVMIVQQPQKATMLFP